MPRGDAGPRRRLVTLLFTDIVGSTRLAEELGDRRWRQLLARHHSVVRRSLKRFGGREVDTAGDGFFAVFDQPADAVEAALTAGTELRRLGVEIRAGIHMGEVEIHGPKVTGIAVHVAARVMSEAGAGEVLVSGTVRELMAGSEINFEDRGFRELKGVAAQQHLFSVRAHGDEPEHLETVSAAPAEDTEEGRPRRRAALAAAAAVALVLALVAVLLPTLGEDRPSATVMPAGMALMNASTWERVGFVPLSKVKTPAEAIFADGRFWVLNLDPVSFVEIDPKSGRILTSIATPYDDAGYFAVDGDDLWVADYASPEVAKVSISRARVVDRYPTSRDEGGSGNFGVAVGAGSVWVTQRDGGPVTRLDADTGKIQHVFDEIVYPNGIAFGDGAVWVAGGVGTLSRIDPATGAVTSAKLPGGVFGSYVVAGGGYGWTEDESKGVVYQADPAGNLIGTHRTGDGARTLAFNDGMVWVGNQDAGTVTSIDVVTGKQVSHAFRHPLQAVAAGDGVVLVQLNPGRTYEDRIEALRGKVAKLLVQPYQLEFADPPTLSSPLGFEVEYATCAPLLSYGDTGDAPPQLAPEVAEGMPQVSPDGRTYTFEIREGFRFSPPSGEPVTAETFRYSIERALSPKMDVRAHGAEIIDDIQGERAFLDGDAERIEGLRAEGNRLTITLGRASGSFLTRLSMPYFCPVPTDSPVVDGGAVTKLSGAAGTAMVASAGPYYLADSFNGEYQILKRNPNYGGSRPQTLDAIALREGIDPGAAIGRVQDGSWDGIMNLYDGSLSPYGALATGGDANAEGLKYRAVPLPGLDYLALNASRPLFRSRDVRRAVALALDRTAAARPFDEIAATNLLPPPLSGSSTDLSTPDLVAARDLIGNAKLEGVIASYAGCDPCLASVEAVRSSLARIGIRMTIREVSDPSAEAAKPGSDIDLFGAFQIQDYADAASFLRSELTEAMPESWLPPGVAGAVRRLDGARAPERDTAAQRLAGRLATDEIPVVAFGAGSVPSYLSARLGCQVFPPYGFGVDFAALCLRASSA